MKLSVFTLNIWGLRLVSENRTERVKALANRLRNGEYDIVCLQELWCENDWRYLKEYCKTKFKYIHYFNSGMLGSGMCIMSCYPIIDIHYHSFILNGYLHMVMHGDWFGGKGVGLCRIDVQGFVVDVYTTHLHACYNPSNDKYIIHRVIQAFETANFIRITSNSSDLAILAGDINSDPNDICYKLISFGANMKDCYLACPSNSVKCTFSHPQNSYRNPSEGESRIDYILYKFNKKNSVSVKEHRYALPSRVPGQNFSYSDHESIEAVFEITANKDNFDKDIKINDNLLRKIELQKLKNDSLQICNENLE
ncbi:putative neutral sphingomyelinase isoform X2 [Sipha flava]|uniref:sphingomyelin phosphodiesterase n=1 Tax=Sipha flava TaxID=143950 RepID=A0A8B8FXV4_9HEMI|nr:putative neutral sphingomyelinase isoform X2 [Sipha flava]